MSESGQWWGLYYGGIDTVTMTKADMRARAELLRAHAFKMAGCLAVPPHAIPPAPVVTRGPRTAGLARLRSAVVYSVQRQDEGGKPG